MALIRKIVVPVVCLVLLFFLEYLGILSGMNHYFYDLAFRIRGPEKPFEKITIVAVDEKTLAALGRWPLKRSHYAAALERMKAAEAIGFDIVLAEPSPDDAALAGAIRRHGGVVLPVVIEESMTLAYPAKTLGSVRSGHVHIERGIDNIAREIRHTLSFQGRLLPSLSSVLFEIAGKTPFKRAATGWDDHESIVQSDPARINFYGGPGTFPRLSLLDVINGVYPPAYFQGKVILIGATAMGLVDSAMTPYAESRLGTSGVEIQATVVSNLFLGDAIRVVPPAVRWMIVLVVGLVLYLLFYKISEGRGVILLIIAVLLHSLVIYLFFSQKHIWCAPAGAYVAFLTLFAAAYTIKLHEAAASLGRTYAAIQPHLRSRDAREGANPVGKGIPGILTPRGIQSQASVLNEITNQLIFEKELSDRILLSDVFAVAVFGPNGEPVISNRDVRDLSRANAIALDDRDRFLEGLAPLVMEKGLAGVPFQEWLQRSPVTVSLTQPEKRYLKADISLLPVGDRPFSLFILTDITKLKEVEILKGQIVSIVSHELKTPMTNIMGFSEILAGELEGRMKHFAGIILEESARLTQFVNTFLDINRIEEGRQQIRKVPVDLSELLEEAARTLAPLAESRGMNLLIQQAAGLAPVAVDRDLTKQCMINLAENAMKYSPPNRDVTLRVEETAEAVHVQIIDQGYGIRKENLDRIFEKFFRAVPDEIEGIKGSGLGLTFVKGAMEVQGGRITVTSTFGKGSTFSLVFPKTA
ncbi:MAG: Alkaline phosphatase synthesis sensor protein PhoR [Syntrophaceae bacterium PtaU1.Bin231]|nr:MAG: Alkaline phosphatase synthesis sensor protein PhoR [Syntrophaceae bacterium PtaU1.Bin231]